MTDLSPAPFRVGQAFDIHARADDPDRVLVLGGVALVVVIAERALDRRRQQVEVSRTREPLTVPLGRWTWVAWLAVAASIVSTLAALAVETDDGATVYAEYSGRMHFDTMTIYAAPLFHTGDERYAWLNRVQGVAKGSFPERGKLVYEIYELV